MKLSSSDARRLIVPEVVQTSAMDCGPAALKCLLAGFGIQVSYGRLREACQTDVDGTSIDTLEEVAVQLGLEAEQTMMPVDHVLLREAQALPAIIVVYLPNGATHFVVAWRRHGNLMQLMDPGTGRRWPSCRSFLKEVYQHVFPVPASAWRKWAGSDEFTGALTARMLDAEYSETGIARAYRRGAHRLRMAVDRLSRRRDAHGRGARRLAGAGPGGRVEAGARSLLQ